MITILQTIEELSEYRRKLTGRVGFVPTMGALHEGHAELLRNARKQSDHLILSIFINPTQFNDPNDFQRYPQTLEQDQNLAEREKVDAIFLPTYNQLYPDGYFMEVREKKWSKKFCGAHREGHFEGVLTIVLKLFNLVKPHFAFFGEKDFQQLQLIQSMVNDFFLDLKIIGIPTVREKDGLAMSSRNMRLSPSERNLAPLFYKTLIQTPSATVARKKLEELGFQVDYIEDWNDRRLGAVIIGQTRLIDNIQLNVIGCSE